MECKTCTPKEWAILPIRFTLGILFLASGLPKLMALLAGNSSVITYFETLGIPLAGFFVWVVALVEVFGGIFLMLGFMIWWSSLLLSIIIVVAAITTVFSIPGFDVMNFVYHLVFFGGLLTVMHGSRFLSLDLKCCKHGKIHPSLPAALPMEAAKAAKKAEEPKEAERAPLHEMLTPHTHEAAASEAITATAAPSGKKAVKRKAKAKAKAKPKKKAKKRR